MSKSEPPNYSPNLSPIICEFLNILGFSLKHKSLQSFDLQAFVRFVTIFVTVMVRLTNQFIEDLEKIAAISKKAKYETIDLEIDNINFKSRYNTAQLIQSDVRAKKKL